jgi:DNA-binding NarL/FixJ family response regulator
MEVEMPGLDGIAAVKQLRDLGSRAKVVMVSAHGGEEEVMLALAVGASGYCLKTKDQARLLTAVKCVFAGDVWLDAGVASIVLRAVTTNALTKERHRPPDQEPLSDRELEVLEQLVEGHSNQEIGRRLFISSDTVKTHIRHIMEKMAVNDRTQVAVKAVRQGLV